MGDAVLRTVARLLRQACRETDLIARYGGEEFVLLFLEADQEQARHICEKIRRIVAEYPWQIIHAALRVKLSIGLSSGIQAGGRCCGTRWDARCLASSRGA